jgi:hypothetical protein
MKEKFSSKPSTDSTSTAAKMATICYSSLDRSRNEIRLIELLPKTMTGPHQDELPLHCKIFHVSLNENPQYMALSYTWGDPRDTQTIIIGNTPVPVTRNLHSAMHHLLHGTNTKVVWIDALCINQTDDEEKSWQVQLMKEIYQRADHVSVWLGPADATSDTVMDFLHSFGTKAMACGIDLGPELAKERWRILASQAPSCRDRSTRQVIVEPPYSPGNRLTFPLANMDELYYSVCGTDDSGQLFPVDGMNGLFTRSWWGRIWTLQEITLAKKAQFICGTKKVSRRRCTATLNAFCALRAVITEKGIDNRIDRTGYPKSFFERIFDHRPTVMLCTRNKFRGTPFPLLALLRVTCIGDCESIANNGFQHFDATDPRDKIYGLLGLVDDKELQELGLKPNYTQSCREIYTNVAAALLRQGHLCILSLCQFSKTRLELPSWVPDWSTPMKPPLQYTDNDHMTLIPGYTASRDLPKKLFVSNTVGKLMGLSLFGLVYDKIFRVGTTWADACVRKDHPLALGKRWLASLMKLSSFRGECYKNLKDRVCTVARVATAGIGLNDTGTWERTGDERFHTAMKLLLIRLNDIDDQMLFSSGFTELMAMEGLQPTINNGVPLDMRVFAYLGEMDSQARGKKPFITEKGHLGLGSVHLQPGDSVAIFGGAAVPFVLRERGDKKYQLIGEAYVDKIMDGEAVASSTSPRQITLY